MSNSDDEAQAAAHFVMAIGSTERMRHYLGRGRELQFAAQDDLQLHFVQLFRAWAADPLSGVDRSPLDDVRCEYELRGLTPPFDLVKDDLELIVKAIGDSYDQMDDEMKAEANEEILAEYRAAKKSQN